MARGGVVWELLWCSLTTARGDRQNGLQPKPAGGFHPPGGHSRIGSAAPACRHFPHRAEAVSDSALPDGSTLLALERRARRQGSAVTPRDLIGSWQLLQVWPRQGGQPNAFSSWLLRGLNARLEIRAPQADTEAEALDLCNLDLRNTVQLAGLTLRFRGRGRLEGKRPLLQFQFQQLELAVADRVLLRRPLPAPDPRRLPFFALIGRDPGGWLAARGRGGGLALWSLAPDPRPAPSP